MNVISFVIEINFFIYRFFIDRDPKDFELVLSYLRNGKLKYATKSEVNWDDFADELQYYGIRPNFVSPQQEEMEKEREREAQLKKCEDAQRQMHVEAAKLAALQADMDKRETQIVDAECSIQGQAAALKASQQVLDELKETLCCQQCEWEQASAKRINEEKSHEERVKIWQAEDIEREKRLQEWKEAQVEHHKFQERRHKENEGWEIESARKRVLMEAWKKAEQQMATMLQDWSEAKTKRKHKKEMQNKAKEMEQQNALLHLKTAVENIPINSWVVLLVPVILIHSSTNQFFLGPEV